MSTNSTIIVKINRSDYNKVKKFSKEKLPVPLDVWDEWGNEVGVEKSKPIKITGEYLAIYCHWDGDESGVGAALKSTFDTYDKILNLVLGGFCSVINTDSVRHYANRKGEKWEYIKPINGNTIGSILNDIPNFNVYLYDVDNGWRVRKGSRFVFY